MKIINISNYIYNKPLRKRENNVELSGSMSLNNLKFDVVSFSAKPYSDAIINPTGHCAYCGCKIYSENQIDSIAKELLTTKSYKLRGKIKSVLEKLNEAKNSSEITIAKQIANKDKIEFFQKFLDLSSKKAYLSGLDILNEIYQLSEEDAFKLLKTNLTPLLATVDHISPQNEGQENKHSDMNLVETCCCCNRDIKNGTPFSEFYMLFPSIKNNMPPEKFDYAYAQISVLSEEGIFQKISVSNMLKLLDRLFVERNDAINKLSSVDFRLKTSQSHISGIISELEAEITSKSNEASQLQIKLNTLKQDADFAAMLKAIELDADLKRENNTLNLLRSKRDNLSNSINKLKNSESKKSPSGKQKHRASLPLTEEEKRKKQQKLDELYSQLDAVENDICSQEEKVLNCQIAIDEHYKLFPSVEMLQNQKNNIEAVINAFIQLDKSRAELEDKKRAQIDYTSQGEQLQCQIRDISIDSFDITSYSQEEQTDFENYKSLLEAKKYIEERSNGDWIRKLIRQYAKEPIEDEIDKLTKKTVVVDYLQFARKKELQGRLNKVNENLNKIKNDIRELKNKIAFLSSKTVNQSKVELEQKSKELEIKIRELNDKHNNIKIPQLIKGLGAEIALLRKYIEHLKLQDAKISQVIGNSD